MIHLVQLSNGASRRVAIVEEPNLRCIEGAASVYELLRAMPAAETAFSGMVQARATGELLDYGPIYAGRSDWRLLPPIDVPGEPRRCMVSGTGLTHLGSARDRQAMHRAAAKAAETTDSMRMFSLGVEGGRPESGKIGVAPEWFYKGDGSMVRAHLDPLLIPEYAEDGGEEAEVAGIYFIAQDGAPRRIGLCIGNEFSDHKFERRNYLNLAGSKLRTCSLGPELVVGAPFQAIAGEVVIDRAGSKLWQKAIETGEDNMCHSLANLEHHHFKFEAHRQPGDIHVHFYGAHSLSFGDQVELAPGDWITVSFDGLGRPLRNPVARTYRRNASPVQVVPLD
jgi:hypothetical protein